MDYKYIEQLLERYWQCETTLEEEQILRSFFKQQGVPEHLQQYTDLFCYENEASQEHLSDEFKQRILDVVDEEPAVEAKTIKFVSRITPLFKAAAVVAIALTIGNIAERTLQDNSLGNKVGSQSVADTYTRTEDITATIHVIDRNQSASMAKADTVQVGEGSKDVNEFVE